MKSWHSSINSKKWYKKWGIFAHMYDAHFTRYSRPFKGEGILYCTFRDNAWQDWVKAFGISYWIGILSRCICNKLSEGNSKWTIWVLK